YSGVFEEYKKLVITKTGSTNEYRYVDVFYHGVTHPHGAKRHMNKTQDAIPGSCAANLSREGVMVKGTKRYSRAAYSIGCHDRHSFAPIGMIKGAWTLDRTTPSDVAQKLLPPVLADTGVAIATNSLQSNFGHVGANVNLYPDLSHHIPTVQVDFASDESKSPACFGDTGPGCSGSTPSEAKSRAYPLAG